MTDVSYFDLEPERDAAPLIPVERFKRVEARDVSVGDTVQSWDCAPFTVTAIREAAAGALVEFHNGVYWVLACRPTEELDIRHVVLVADNEVFCECGAVLVTDRRGFPQRCDVCDDGRDCVL